MDDVFNIENFNIIQDSDNYYFFRALNMADNADIDGNITTDENGNITRIRTDRERWEETHTERAPRYNKEVELSLRQINDHIKMRYSKETNCISLSSNANVSIVYGRGSYTDKYVIVKVPKNEMGKNIVNAGQYMLEEVEKRINEAIEGLNKTENEELFNLINQIRNATTSDEIADSILSSQKLNTTSQMNYMGTKIKDRADALPARARLSNYQSLNEEQTLEKNKIMGILTVLERKGVMEPIIPNTTTNSNLARTIGNAFSSSEVIHYGDIDGSEITPVSKDIMDMFAILQQVKEKNPKEAQKINEIEKKLLEYASKGYEIQNNNGALVFTNGQEMISIDGTSQSLLELQETELPDISIEDMYEITQGKIDYKSAMQVQKMLFYANKAKGKAIAFSNLLREITENDSQYAGIIQSIKSQAFSIEPEIITRRNESGYKLSESVNIGANKEEIELIQDIQNLPDEKIIEMIESKSQIIESDIVRQRFSKIMYDTPMDKQTYYAKAVMDSYNWDKTGIGFRPEERQEFEKRLKNTDIIKLYEKLTKLNLPEKTISQIILNIAMNKNFSNILNADNFEEQIKEHTEELTQDLSIDQVETFLGYYDVPGTDIVLREYQQRAVNNANKKFEEKQFASVILPTGAGKSFVAISELLAHKDEPMLYLAPSNEILNQIKKYIVENIHGTKGTLNKSADEVVKEVFPNLELATYQSLLHKKKEELANSKYDFIILDELHRTGAYKWQKKLELLLESQEKHTNILGITATPERDADGRNMADELALKIGKKYGKAYTEEEVKNGKHIAMKMDLIEAIRLGIVVNPKIVSCEYNITHGDTLEKILERINQIEDEDKRNELLQKYEIVRRNLSNAQGIPELLTQNIQKKNGRYIVFIPVSDNGEDLEDEYGNKSGKKTQEDKIKEAEMQLREWLKGVDETKYDDKGNIIDGPEIYSMLGQYSQKRNAKELNGFETSDSEHMKIMIVMNKLNEGVHVKGIDGIIWTRALDENSKILLLQQLGRAIYGIDPERPVKDEERPVVIDLPNNMLNVDLEKTINTYSQRDDLNLLNEMVEWVQAHNGYIPDINSKSSEESRRAITLKRIQRKYEKYLQNPEEEYSYLDEEEIEEIQKILKTGSEIDLWEIEFPDKIGKDGKKIDENELENINFFVEGTLKDLYELKEDINDEEEKGTVERFIRKIEKLKGIGVNVTKIVQRDNIKKLAKKSGIDEIKIKEAGLNPCDKIGITKSNIAILYRKAKEEGKITRGTPTDEQVETLGKLGISLEKRDAVQEFIETIETLKGIGVDVTKIAHVNNIKELAKKSGIDEIKIKEAGLNPSDNIRSTKNNIAASYKAAKEGKKTSRIPPTDEQVETLRKLGISLETGVQKFIETIETLKRIGVDVTKIATKDNIKELAKKSGIDEIKIKEAGLNPDDKIWLSKQTITTLYREAKEGKEPSRISPTDEQVETLRKLGISLEKRDAVQEHIETIEKLEGIGVDVTKIVRRDNIKELAKKSGIDEIKIKEAGLNPGDNIGLVNYHIAISYREAKEGKKSSRTPPTDEQVERLRELGISLERKRKSSKALAEATISAIKDPDMLDEEQQALDAIVSQTKEKGGKNGKEQS